MDCPRCKNENPTDYPVCGPCSQEAHCTHRFCLCLECKRERDLAWLADTRRKIVAAHTHLLAKLSGALAADPEFNRLHSLTLYSIERGYRMASKIFAAKLASHARQMATDTLAFGDEPQLLADIRDERNQLPKAA